ncbi:MAG TPA: hypothetical protein VL049_01780 [Candidatus Dormibacteraeota bacterium]|nr:hypothetical protein [Candidatus Dormibacteraeota bacterium]
MRGVRISCWAAVTTIVALTVAQGSAPAAECSNDFPSTFAAIQKVIFEGRGCTSAACHDASASGGLNLTADVAFDNLVGKPSETVPGWTRVQVGEKDRSLLFINVAAKTTPETFTAPLRAMPLGVLPALSTNELEALRKWIEVGAPREGTVAGTADLLDACLPPQEPIQIEPLPPPAAGEGVQLHMPRWIVKAKSESEVCYASYYDFTDQVPEQFRGPNGTLRYKREQIRQDPLSHHLIVNLYDGVAGPHDPVWGTFKCRGGAKDDQVCDPTDVGFCGTDGECANDPMKSIACFSQANLPPDSGLGVNGNGFTGTQEAATTIDLAPGVYGELPLKGMIIWNSHAFNTTDTDGKLEGWINFDFAPPEEQLYPLDGIFAADKIFTMNVPAFHAQEVCNVFELPPNAKLFEISSHMHQRGKRWRTFDGAWRCDGGENAGAACSPYGPDAAYETPDICAGAPCRSVLPPAGGDCNADMVVTIDELVRSVGIALGAATVDTCPRGDVNEDGTVSIDEIVKAVKSAGEAGDRDPDASLMYTSFIYNDPVTRTFAPPLAMGGTYSVPAERSLTYCALYDNGYTDPAKVKRKSTSPPTPIGIPGLLGGPCIKPTGCTDGKLGEPCSGNTPQQLDASCDSADGAGDGVCDACPLLGGVTTEDEMFILLGSFFVKK